MIPAYGYKDPIQTELNLHKKEKGSLFWCVTWCLIPEASPSKFSIHFNRFSTEFIANVDFSYDISYPKCQM